MTSTSTSLLLRLRDPRDQIAWKRFALLYTPLLFHWARERGLREADAADLVQDVFTILLKKLPEFHYDPQRRFRAWLRTVTLNRLREGHRRAVLPVAADSPAALSELAGPDGLDAFLEAEHSQYLAARALSLMQAEFEPTTWRACWEVVVTGRPPQEVAAELGISLGAVYTARCRVLRRLREELAGLLD